MRSLEQDIKGFHSLLMLMLTIQSFLPKLHPSVLVKSAVPREKIQVTDILFFSLKITCLW